MSMNCPHCGKRISLAVMARGMGQKGGSRSTAAKRQSSRENGKLGGRRKQKGKKR